MSFFMTVLGQQRKAQSVVGKGVSWTDNLRIFLFQRSDLKRYVWSFRIPLLVLTFMIQFDGAEIASPKDANWFTRPNIILKKIRSL